MVEKQIGKRIQELRKKKGLTQEQLAERIGMSPNHYSSMERGVYGIKLPVLVQIMNCLECSADEIFADVINSGYVIRSSKIADQLEDVSPDEQAKILDVLELMIKNSKKK